jgi:hypothetical protein
MRYGVTCTGVVTTVAVAFGASVNISGMVFGAGLVYASLSTNVVVALALASTTDAALSSSCGSATPSLLPLADGRCDMARFGRLGGVAVANGLVFVADVGNGVVRVIDPASGAVAGAAVLSSRWCSRHCC